MKKITIYTNETCPYCKKIKEALDNDGGFDIENKLTSEFTGEYRQLSNLLGMGTVPLIVYDGNYLLPARDFRDEKHLVAILNSIIKSEFSFDEMTYQRLITLNYNISVAFNKFEDIIAKIELKMK
jgi:glutaredoxin